LTVREISYLHLQLESISLREGALFWERRPGFVSQWICPPLCMGLGDVQRRCRRKDRPATRREI